MGSCSIKTSGKENQKVIITRPENESLSEEFKRAPKDLNLQSRKNLKQKAAVADSRLRNSVTSDAPTAIVVEKSKTDQDIKLIIQSLEKHFIFNSLTNSQRKAIIQCMKFFELAPSQIVFEQGTKGSAFFIIASGRVEVIINDKKVTALKPGDSFGELALLHDTLRSATVKTLIKTSLWCLDRTTFRSTIEELNAQNHEENKHFIDSIPVFKDLNDKQRELLISSLSLLKFSNGTKIVSEGDPGDLLYIIKEGSVVCTQQGKEVRKMYKGEYFGEQALYYGSPRTATIIAAEDVACVALGREDLVSCLGASLHLVIYKNTMRIAFLKNSNLSKLLSNQAENLISEMEIQSYAAGQVVIPAGTPKKSGFYIVVKGELNNSIMKDHYFRLLDVIGDEAVINDLDGNYDADIVSTDEVDIAHISNSGFFNCIGGDFSHITSTNEAMNSLKRVNLFKALNNEQLLKLVGALKIQEFDDGQVILEQNNTGENFYLIRSGKVEIIKDGQSVRSISKNDYFGERSLLFDDYRSASVVARHRVSCWVMSKSNFMELLHEKIRNQLMERIELQDDTIALSDLSIVKTLGNGMFGNVFLVVHRSKRTTYALKAVDRRKIAAYQIEENIVLERKILLELVHPLILKLVKTTKDNKRLYFLMEYIRGMDLFDVIRKLQLLKECDARFYIGCILTIIEHLHERDIIFRDLKPENMVVDSVGYPKLIDFGTAKFIKSRTYTIVGTPHYMAPEVVTGHGYGLPADY